MACGIIPHLSTIEMEPLFFLSADLTGRTDKRSVAASLSEGGCCCCCCCCSCCCGGWSLASSSPPCVASTVEEEERGGRCSSWLCGFSALLPLGLPVGTSFPTRTGRKIVVVYRLDYLSLSLSFLLVFFCLLLLLILRINTEIKSKSNQTSPITASWKPGQFQASSGSISSSPNEGIFML